MNDPCPRCRLSSMSRARRRFLARCRWSLAPAVTVAALVACGAGVSVPSPARAQAAPPPAAATEPPAAGSSGAGDAAPPSARPSAASDEDLEAAVLGGAPASTPARPAPSRPRAAIAADPFASPPPAPPAVEHRRSQRSDRARAAAAVEAGDADAPAFALELDTVGLGSAQLSGGIFAGARLPSGLIVGGLLDYASSVASLTASPSPAPTTSQSSSMLRFGAAARQPLIRTEDRRVDLFIAGELDLVRTTREVVAAPSASYDVSALGLTVAAGPGLRLWVHEHVAIGYAAQLRVTHLGGKAGAFPQAAAGAPSPSADASSTDLAFDGTFQLLGVF